MNIMDGHVDKISIDYDDLNIRKLILSYINIKKWFKGVPIKVEISSSGTGFHIIIYKEVTISENLMWRAFLGDDPVRISYSLRRLLLNSDPYVVDILFTKKDGRYVKELDLDYLFIKYNIKVDEVNDENFEEIYKTILPEIKRVIGKVYYLVVPVNDVDDELLDKIYADEGIRLNRVRSYCKDYKEFVVARKIGTADFSDIIDILNKYVGVAEHWILEDELK